MTNATTINRQRIDSDITVGFDICWPCNNYGVYRTLTRTVRNIHEDEIWGTVGEIKFNGYTVVVCHDIDNVWDTVSSNFKTISK